MGAFKSPLKILLPVRIDERKRQRSTGCKPCLQLRYEVVHLLQRRVRENRIGKNDVEVASEIRNRKINDPFRVERAVVAIVMGPVRIGKHAAAVADRILDHVDAVVITWANLTGWI